MQRGFRTHAAIDRRLVGVPVALDDGRAIVRLATTAEMAADDRGLVHGGFLFGVADYAAMLAVNEPTVVLAGCECRFVAPVVVGDRVEATAEVLSSEGKKRLARVVVTRDGTTVFEGTFHCAVPARHVLDREPPTGRGAAR
jgi:acyl-coenzyme A thioesterase PaaI-like protein